MGRWVLIAGLLVVGCAPSPAALTAEDAAAVESEVRAALERYLELTNGGEWDGTLAHFSSDERFHWAEQGRIAYASHEDVAAAFASLAGTIESLELALRDVRVIPLRRDLAMVSTGFDESLRFDSGIEVPIEGWLTILMERQDGQWKFLVGHSSSPPPPPAAAPEPQ